jgi:pyruvate dehydrogenase E2 component (dihydrolipoamide acetyltransferase)
LLDFKFADIGEGIHEGTILKWLVKEGDEVKDGDTLCLVETDKVNAEIPSPVNGKIIKLMAEVGDNIEVGDVLVKIDDGSADTDSTKTEEESAGVIGEIEVSSEVIASSYEQESSKTETIGKVLATPVARKLAKDLGVDITQVKGTGIQGRVMKEDIYHAKEVTSTKPQFDAPKLEFTEAVERVKVSKLRKTIAKNMVLAKSIIPHTTSMDEFDVTDLVKFRKEHKEMARANNIHLTYLPFIIKAVVLTLKEYRILNSSYDQENEEIIYKNYYNIGIAVDTDDGLIVPVIKNADKLGIFEIAKELKEITTTARERTIALDKLQNGTFTITNYGAGGSSFGVPIIRYPEVAILGIGLITKKPVVLDEEIVIRDLLPVSLSYDHRIVDGGDAGRFLTRLKAYLQDPMLLLLS